MRLELLFCVITSVAAFGVRPSGPLRLHHGTSLHASASAATSLPEGILKTVSKPGSGLPLQLGDIATVRYSCYLPDQAPFAKSSRQKVVVGDGAMIDGWEKTIRGMCVGERSIIRVTDPALAYGAAGAPPLIPPNAVVEMDVEIIDSQPPTANIDFDNLALDSTPTTASEIARAFEARQAAKEVVEEKEGLDWLVDKVKSFYFYGLFEGETGERPPWFLRPSITFPIAFVIVGAAFWVAFVNGAITERGAQTTDELDEIILSSTAMTTLALSAFASLAETGL